MLDRAAEAKVIAADADLPFVSVVMPVLDEACFIARSLGAILEQDYPAQRMEVIVADGMSTDGTRRIVASMQGRHLNVRLADNCKGTASAALNTALEQARGEVIMRVDGHCEIESGYVRRCVECLQSRSVDAVGGGCRAVGDTLVAGAIAAAMSSRFGVGDAAFRTARNRTMLVDTIFPPAYTRSIVERAGPFDEELVRDQDD